MYIPVNTKCIVWDLDGTILDSFGLFKDILSTVLRSKGLPIPDAQRMQQNFHGILEDSIRDITALGGDELDEVVAEFLTLQDPYYDRLDGHIFSDSLNLMTHFDTMGLQQIVITNRAHIDRKRASPKHIIAQPPLNRYITHVVCGDDNEFHKPDARVLDAVAADMDIDRQSVLVIGDRPVDAELAQNLNAQCILVDRDGELATFAQSSVTIVSTLDMIDIER